MNGLSVRFVIGLHRMLICFFILLVGISSASAQQPTALPFRLVFVSNRQHYWYPHVYVYEHDGKSSGKLLPVGEHQDKWLEHQPVLSGDGKICFFGREAEGGVGQIHAWDFASNQPRSFGDLFQTPNAVFSPSVSFDGKLLALSTWNRPGSSARWDVSLYDLERRKAFELPGLNTTQYDERRTALSGDGLWLAYSTNNPDGVGLTDIRLYDLQSKQISAMAGMNSPATDSFPSLSRDARLICFASDREGGEGGFDVYLYDRVASRLIPVPGLNSPAHEQSPFISHDGRLVAFVSERFGAAGEHDIFIYERASQRLLETPGLNTDRDDYDPCVIPLAR